jgi:hypothetical protein
MLELSGGAAVRLERVVNHAVLILDRHEGYPVGVSGRWRIVTSLATRT